MNRYSDIEQYKTSTGKTYLGTTYYPEIPYDDNDIYVYTVQGDRLDNLAFQFYQDSTLYWIIAAANPTISLNSFYLPIGSQLRIPANPDSVINSFNNLNNG
jgi:phage tail protein X